MPNQRSHSDDIDRIMIVAEAKLLTSQLASYLELIGEWALEENDA